MAVVHDFRPVIDPATLDDRGSYGLRAGQEADGLEKVAKLATWMRLVTLSLSGD